MAESKIVEMLGDSTKYFAAFGAVAAAYMALKFLCSVMSGIRNFLLASIPDFKKYGSWAVVTGATDGIGKAYAEVLAEKGLNVVLISRSPEKLEDVATQIKTNYRVQTKTIAADFSNGMEIYDKIKQELSGLDVGVLINNVGVSYKFPNYFDQLTEKEIQDLMVVNMYSVTMMTKIILPRMAEKHKGVIVNVSSGSGTIPQPLLAVYSSAKAYVDFFSRGLSVEYSSKGIIVQCVHPYFVATKLSAIRKATFFAPSPMTFVRSALATVGSTDRTYGCLSHSLQGYIYGCFPSWVFDKVSFSMLSATMKRGLKKYGKQK